MTTSIVSTAQTDLVLTGHEAQFDELIDLTARQVADSSARIYRQTYDLWRRWCAENAVAPMDFRPAHVLAFIDGQDTTKATRQRQLSALRKLAQMAYTLTGQDDARRMYEALTMVKPPAATKKSDRQRQAYAPREADKLLRIWDDQTAAAKRNRALIAVLLLGGIRRSEAAAMRWQDVDFDNGVLHIAHGKGDKRRDVPLAGNYAVEALREWQMAQSAGYKYVFTPIKRGDHVAEDTPISGTDVYRIWQKTADVANVKGAPHDARRTFITEALATGTPLATAQAIAGHARGETTLRYAQAVDARRARKDLKLRYG